MSKYHSSPLSHLRVGVENHVCVCVTFRVIFFSRVSPHSPPCFSFPAFCVVYSRKITFYLTRYFVAVFAVVTPPKLSSCRDKYPF